MVGDDAAAEVVHNGVNHYAKKAYQTQKRNTLLLTVRSSTTSARPTFQHSFLLTHYRSKVCVVLNG
jgi:hypothetical protein